MRGLLATAVGPVAAVIVLAAGSTLAVGGASGALTGTTFRGPSSASCPAPDLSGTVVDVSLIDMGHMVGDSGHSMMGAAASGAPGGSMRMLVTPTSVPAGPVSFRVHNVGSRAHELVVLAAETNHQAGQRSVGSDARIDEAGSLGEASRTCGSGAGHGIAPGAAGWVTVTLRPGFVELACNLAHHYSSGMFSMLTVTGTTRP